MLCNFELRKGRFACKCCGRIVRKLKGGLTSDRLFYTCECPEDGSEPEFKKRDRKTSVRVRSKLKNPKCIHLGADTGEIVLIECDTCQGRTRIKHHIHLCPIFTKCLPEYQGEVAEGHGCVGCNRKEVKNET